MIIPKTKSPIAIQTERDKRIIGQIGDIGQGPTVVFFAGIHGNEPAGVKALRKVTGELKSSKQPMNGNFLAIAGNLAALEKNIRFQSEDLNRIWLPERIKALQTREEHHSNEDTEMLSLYHLLQDVLNRFQPPFYFIDIHTTSGKTSPFVIANDSLLNRRFVVNYPLPIILGIEEYLAGALLSYINEMGYVAFGFEAGQHVDPKAVENAVDFIHYSISLIGLVPLPKAEQRELKTKIAFASRVNSTFYEIRYQYLIKAGATFEMLPGYHNFQKIKKGKPIALSNGQLISTQKRRLIFLPRYQKRGHEGFYFIAKTPRFFLWLSKMLRRFRADRLLVTLPGIQWQSKKRDTLFVDLKVARYLAKPIFHLLGYRARKPDETHFVLKSREIASKTADYKNENWF